MCVVSVAVVSGGGRSAAVHRGDDRSLEPLQDLWQHQLSGLQRHLILPLKPAVSRRHLLSTSISQRVKRRINYSILPDRATKYYMYKKCNMMKNAIEVKLVKKIQNLQGIQSSVVTMGQGGRHELVNLQPCYRRHAAFLNLLYRNRPGNQFHVFR